VLFPAITVAALAAVWGMTANLVRIERAASRQAALASTRELAETYEAQVLRALREIDQGLSLVRYAMEHESDGGAAALQKLKSRGLLPSDLVFVVSILDAGGRVVASTRAIQTGADGNEDQEALRRTGNLVVSRPWRNPQSGEWTLRFGRALTGAAGDFRGAVTITVDAAYFVSGYEPTKLGEHGMLAVLGKDGVLRVRRSGDNVAAGDVVDFNAAAPHVADEEAAPERVVTPWDGITRYTAARPIFGFPLAVVVGLSEVEQLASTQRDARRYIWRAAGGSIVLVAVMLVLWRMSRQLALARQREADAKVAYAQRVEYMAYHDSLTGLPNRSMFSKLLEHSISVGQRYGRRLAVLFLDLDRFKQINDTLGHEAGDELLKEVAVRLKACLRESDTVARLGGDEFVVMLPEMGDETRVAGVAQKMLHAIAKPFLLLGQEFRISVSIGISVYPQHGQDEETLKKNADIAMYKAKEEGKNNYQFFSEALSADSLERMTLESSLRSALEQKQFQLHYQPKRDFANGQMSGVEALLRWKHPDLGVIAPMKFLPIAEETGLIIPIGKWVLMTACKQSVDWQKQGLPRLRIAVNLSARQFNDDDLLKNISAVLAESRLDPELLELEIAEAVLMRDMDRTLRILKALKDQGVRIAIDDFGTGYASLTTLRQYPIDTIKIDRSVIRDLAKVKEERDLTAAIIAMGQSLSLTVVAQGVETREQAELLRSQSCDEFQGFYLNRPMPSEELAELMRSSDAHRPETAPQAG